MSEQEALRFLKEIPRYPDARRELQKLKGSHAVHDLTVLAETLGYHFSEAEYRSAIVTLSEGELSPESLDALIQEMTGTP